MNTDSQADLRKETVKEHFTDNAAYWDELYNEDFAVNRFYSHEIKSRKEVVFDLYEKNTNGKPIKAIDVGCGAGHYVSELKKRGVNIFGSDISKKMIEATKFNNTKEQLNTDKFLCADCQSLPFSDNSFDVVFCIGVLSYVSDELAIFKELKRIVKKDGLIIFNVPNLLKLRNVLDPYYYIFKFWSYAGIKIKKLITGKELVVKVLDASTMDAPQNRYSIKQILNFLSKAGLKSMDIKGYAYGPLRFWRKDILPDVQAVKLSSGIEKLANLRLLRFINKFAVGWVFTSRVLN